MANLKDSLVDRIPRHILEEYPRFFDFIEAYYEWLCREDNPYGALKNHMDYLDFTKTLDKYVDTMKREYLTDVPDKVLVDKELFIKWSKKFNLARGSHSSYKFLFKLLFNEQNTSIYLPKENVLRTSDGNWISGESLIMLTHSKNNLNDFQFQRIFQERVIYKDIIERATAEVQNVRTKYVGKYVVTELNITNIVGEFLPGYPIESVNGASEWVIPTISEIDVIDGGSNYQSGDRVFIQNIVGPVSERDATIDGEFDTRITSLHTNSELTVLVNGVETTNYSFDGRTVYSTDISIGDTVIVNFPPYQGYLAVDSTDDTGNITDIEVLDLPIIQSNSYSLVGGGIGSGVGAQAIGGQLRNQKGRYVNNKGHLSSNMYLQDSFFYQDYSYSIKTQQDYTQYADIVKQVLHPAGFLMVGQLSIINILDLLVVINDEVESKAEINNLHKYGLGTNYNLINKIKDKWSHRLYKQSDLDALDVDFLNGELGYDLESVFLNKTADYEYSPLKGWMQKFNLTDYYLFVPQEYTTEIESGHQYFETGYVSERS